MDFADEILEEQCPRCPRSVDNPILTKLIRYLAMCEAGRPVEPGELSDNEWLLLGALKRKREQLTREKEVAEAEAKKNG